MTPAGPTHVIRADVAREFGKRVFEAVGIPSQHAADAADVLVWASLRGVDSHGLRNLKRYYVDWILDGTINPRPEFQVEYETPVSARTDGDHGLGLAAGCWAMGLAIDKAAKSGTGFVTMRNSHHLGPIGYFACRALEHDMVGISMSGFAFAQGRDFGMAPTFGARPTLGTNPLSFAFPGAEERPFVLDMATSVVPYNRVLLLSEAGHESIPPGWALDRDGRPTTDPGAVSAMLPLGGAREQGGHKGYGLAMVVELLSGVLSGAWCESEAAADDDGSAGTTYRQKDYAHFFGAFRLDLFRPPGEFKKGLDELVRGVRACPLEPGADRIRVAGEPEHEMEEERGRTGIPLTDDTVGELRQLSATYGVKLEIGKA